MRIRSRFMFWFVVVALTPILIIQFILFTFVSGSIRDNALKDFSLSNQNLYEMTQGFVDSGSSLAVALTTLPPIAGIERSKDTGFDEQSGSTYDQWISRLQTIFTSFVESNDGIYIVRFMDLDGNEVVKVANREDGVEVLEGNELQDKSTHDYFKQGLWKGDGGVYISDVTLNVEFGEIEEPYLPVIRYASPTYVDGELTGLIVVNFYAEKFFQELVDDDPSTVLIDQDGYYLFSAEEGEYFSKQLGRENFFEDHSSIEDKSIRRNDEAGYFFNEIEESHVFWRRIVIDDESKRSILVVNLHPEAEVVSFVNAFRGQMLWISLGMVLLALGLAYVLSRSVSRPIEFLTKATKAVETGGDLDMSPILNKSERDEMYALAQAFEGTNEKVQSSKGVLESEVQKKTSQLEESLKQSEKQNEFLEESNKARLNMLEDISAEKIRNEEISKRLELATQSAHIGIWEWSIEEDKMNWDETMFTIYNITKKDFSNTMESWISFVCEEDKAKVKLEIDQAIKGEKEFNIDFRINCLEDARYLRALASVVRDDTGKAVSMVGVTWDITHEKEVDRAKTDFISVASHQMRTPLSAMRWFTEMLLHGDAGELNPEQKEFVQNISESNKRTILLVNALLNISRIESGRVIVDPEPTDLGELLNTEVNELSDVMAQRQVKVSVDVAEDLPSVNVDPSLISEVIKNLVANAIRYSKPGSQVQVSLTEKGEEIICSVQDFGIGIPKEDQNKIYGKFFRARNAIEAETDGSGLGLYLVKTILNSSGGKIWFESEQNKGTTFFFTLPKSGMKKQEGEVKLIDVDEATQKD